MHSAPLTQPVGRNKFRVESFQPMKYKVGKPAGKKYSSAVNVNKTKK